MSEDQIIDLYKRGFSVKYIVDEYYFKKKMKNFNFYNIGNRRFLICTSNVTKAQCRGEVYKILYNYVKNF